jgi:hypothetical protein
MFVEALSLTALGFFGWRAYKMHRAASTDASANECVSCSSHDLEALAPGAYRCESCGYEGGPGLPALIHQRKAEAIENMAVEQRRERAHALLLDAELDLRTGLTELDRALTASVIDTVGLNVAEGFMHNKGGEKFARIANAMRPVLEARNAVREAELLLGCPLAGGARVDGLDGPETYADAWLDHPVVDGLVHLDLHRVKARVQHLHAQVRYALQQHFGPEGTAAPYRGSA